MKLGLFMMPFHDAARPVSDLFDEDIDKIVLADQLGYTEAWVGQHFTATVEPFASPLMLMSAALPQTKNIMFGTGVINLPCHHPATVAAEIAQFDHMSRGRLLFGIGPGALATDFELFGNTAGWPRLRKMLESVEYIQEIWASDPPYNFEGEFYSVKLETSNAELGTGYMQKPYQQPHPPIATSLMSSYPGLGAMAGENKWIPVSANFIPTASVASHWVKYEEGASKAGYTPDPSTWRVARNIVVAPTDEEARDVAMDPKGGMYMTYDYLWKALSAGGFGNALKSDPKIPDEDITVEGLVDDMVIHGSPTTVIEKLKAFQEVTGPFGTLILALQDWGHNTEQERASMKLLATDVAPHL
ncbi:LLM class flavin-dependent oxidoreductase [Arthrobacter sp. NPDC056691]|uniref:LLM class flavin-dependent oxidoreductase n=1 Tax=Arthrobacter sp. NPDC056691 TaxID=3345913 RepID=UPI00366BE16F